MRQLAARRLVILALLGLVMWTGRGVAPQIASAFTIDDALTHGTPADPSDDLLDAARWTNVPGSLVGEGVRGLGGGIEYAIAPDLCPKLLPRFIDRPAPICDQVLGAIRQAFDRWGQGHPVLRFVDVSGRIRAQIPPQGVRDPWRGFGAEIDLLAFSPREYPSLGRFGSYTAFWYVFRAPMGTNGRVLPGNTLTSADIVLSTETCYNLDPALAGRGCNHFESLVLHEIGHALALDHPNEFRHRNFDSDGDPTNEIPIDCQDPTRGLRLSPNIDPNAVMNSSLGRPEPIHPALTNDDLGGRNFLYPICPGGQAPATDRLGAWAATGVLAAAIRWRRRPPSAPARTAGR